MAEPKHGPLALVSPDTPTVMIAPGDDLWDKSLSSMAEIRARRGPVIAVTDSGRAVAGATTTLTVPPTAPELLPILDAIPLQLLAHHAALRLGWDVDRPRNLATSVTVE